MTDPRSAPYSVPSDLAERLIACESRCRLLERTLREWAEHLEGDRSVGSYVTALQARIAALETNIDRLTRRRSA